MNKENMIEFSHLTHSVLFDFINVYKLLKTKQKSKNLFFFRPPNKTTPN